MKHTVIVTAAIVLVGLVSMASNLSAATLTVSNVSDSGPGSLRAAIDAANQNLGPDTIVFNIPTSNPGFDGSVFTIQPLSALSPLTDANTTIDGATQTAFTGDTNPSGPEVVLNGSQVGFVGGGLIINSSGNIINSLVVNGFNNTGIDIVGAGATSNTITGCYLGTNPTGDSAVPNTFDGIAINGGASNIIGGSSAAERNLISGNARNGLLILDQVGSGSDNNIVQGNFIGTDATGQTALGNSQQGTTQGGIQIGPNAHGNLVGGTTVGVRNIISGNASLGVYLTLGNDTSNNQIQGNFIGTDVTGTFSVGNQGGGGVGLFSTSPNTIGGTTAEMQNVISGNFSNGIECDGCQNQVFQGNLIGMNAAGSAAIPNGGQGVALNQGPQNQGAQNNTIGGTVAGAQNVISGNTGNGVAIFDISASGNAILSNSIYNNGGLGIDLGGGGVTPNDTNDIDAGPNNLQNYPVLTSITISQSNVNIVGALNSIANTTFRLEFFGNDGADSSGFDEGRFFLGSSDVTTDGSGDASFDLNFPLVPGVGRITATATDLNGNTSEFSPASGPVIISVTSATGRTGSPFNFQVATVGGTSAARLSAIGLPPGLTADPLTGEISGTPTSDGSFLVTVTVTEAGLTNTATLELTFTSDPAVPVIVSPNSALLFPGLPFSYTILAPTSDSTDPVTYSEIGLLPPGLGLDPATGIISGTPQIGVGLQPTPSLAGGVVTNVQLFACNSTGCAAQGLFFLLPTGAANISTRLSVGTVENVLIGGFITEGNAPMKLIVRGIGPSLPLGDLLANPYLELHSGPDTLASNDNWKDNLAGGSQEVAIQNTGLAPTNDLESAILSVLDPGGYTAIMNGTNNGTGVGLVEVYNLGAASMDVSSEAHLANISTRGLVQTDANVMIGGFINQGSVPIQVLVRGIGPSLTQFGVSGALANPTLELHKPDGTVVSNDDWMTDPSQKTAITATGLAPKNALESAILVTLPVGEGLYTAIVSGVDGTTGVGLVEAYFGNPCLGTSCP
jgi:hypothetical protein